MTGAQVIKQANVAYFTLYIVDINYQLATKSAVSVVLNILLNLDLNRNKLRMGAETACC